MYAKLCKKMMNNTCLGALCYGALTSQREYAKLGFLEYVFRPGSGQGSFTFCRFHHQTKTCTIDSIFQLNSFSRIEKSVVCFWVFFKYINSLLFPVGMDGAIFHYSIREKTAEPNVNMNSLIVISWRIDLQMWHYSLVAQSPFIWPKSDSFLGNITRTLWSKFVHSNR